MMFRFFWGRGHKVEPSSLGNGDENGQRVERHTHEQELSSVGWGFGSFVHQDMTNFGFPPAEENGLFAPFLSPLSTTTDTILDTPSTIGNLSMNGTIANTIDASPMAGSQNSSTDHDWFKVTLSAGQTYAFGAAITSGLTGDYLGSAAIDLRNSAGALVSGTLNDSVAPTFTYTAQTSGTYFLAISAGGANPTSVSAFFNYSVSALQTGVSPGANVVDPFVPYTDRVPGSPTPTDVANAALQYMHMHWAWDNCTGLAWAVGTEVGGAFYETIQYETDGRSSTIPSIVSDDPFITPNDYHTTTGSWVDGNWTTFESTHWKTDVRVGDIVRIPGTALPNDSAGHSFIVVAQDGSGNWDVIDDTDPMHQSGLPTSDAPVVISEHTFNTGGNGLYSEILAATDAFISRLNNTVTQPDLAISTLNVSPSVAPGGTESINFSIVNSGTASVAATTTSLYLSTNNSTLDGNDTFIGSYSTPALAAGASSPVVNTSTTIPAGLAPGTYYIIAVADSGGVINNEISETNNSFPASFVVTNAQPDLLIDNLVPTATSIVQGSGISFDAHVRNAGTANVNSSFETIIYLSGDDKFYDPNDSNDHVIETFTTASLTAGSSVEFANSVPISSSIGPGNYYLGIYTDYGNGISESNEANNSYAYPTQVTIAAAQPNLVIDDLTPTMTSIVQGSGISFDAHVRNAGTANVNSSFETIIYLSGDDKFYDPNDSNDHVIETFTTASLTAGSSVEFANSVPISSSIGPGNYYLGIYTDYGNGISESNENDNSLAYGTQITITAPDTAPPTIAITSTAGLTNQASQTVSGTVDLADAGTTVTVFDGASALATATVGSDGNWGASIILVGDGAHTLIAKDTDAAGNTGSSNSINYVLDTTPPSLISVSPSTGQQNVAEGANIELTFGENIEAGTGSFVIHNAADNSVVSTINVNDTGQISILGNQLIINPTNDLLPNTAYYVTCGSGTVLDTAGNAFAGISSVATVEFATGVNIINGDDNANTLSDSAGDDEINGNGGNDIIQCSGGDDIVNAGVGDDTMVFGTSLTSADRIDGGAGSDIVQIAGDYSSGLTFAATTMINVEDLVLAAGYSYALTTDDATLAAGQKLRVDGSALGPSNSLTLNGSAETDGNFAVGGGAGSDRITTGAGNDVISTGTGDDKIDMGAGDDFVNFATSLTSADQIDGGAGNDTVQISGDYSSGLIFSATTMVNVEKLTLKVGSDYTLTTNDSTVATGQTLTINASGLGSSNTLSFNGLAETDGAFNVLGGAGADKIATGAGNDTITAGAGDDILRPGDGNDRVNGGDGNDFMNFIGSFTSADRVDGGAGIDTVQITGDYSAGLRFSSVTMVNVEKLVLGAGYDYALTTNDATVAAGQSLTVNASALGASDALTFDGSRESNGAFVVMGGAGADKLTTGAGNDIISAGAGDDTIRPGTGNDTVVAGDGNDVINFGAALTAFDRIDGGSGIDSVEIAGDYSAGLSFSATTMINVEKLILAKGFDYTLATSDATVAAGQTLTVNASALGSANSLSFNGAAELDGNFYVVGGAGGDTISTGSGNDTISAGAGDDVIRSGSGNDKIIAGDGNDFMNFGASLTSADRIDGGTGVDTVQLSGDYSSGLKFSSATMVNVEKLTLGAGFSYALTTNDATVAAGQTLVVNAGALGASNSLTFNGAAETDGHFLFFSGLGADNFTGGALSDTFSFSSAAASSGMLYDTITGLNFGLDKLDIPGSVGFVAAIDSSIVVGSLDSGSNFDSELTAAIGSSLGAHHAELFIPDSGSLSGKTFLIIDLNGVTGYQSGADLVIHLINPTGSLTGATFI